MNWRLVKKDYVLMLKNPLTYLGIFAMILILFMMVSPYFKLYGNLRAEGEEVVYSDGDDIMDGYIPTPEDEIWEYVSKRMETFLTSDYGMSQEDAEKQMKEIRDSNWAIQEIRQYFIDKYDMRGFASVWEEGSYKKADITEMEQYLDYIFQKDTYTNYFARKYADYLGISSILFTMIVFSILLIRDMRKNVYSFIHTKPISGRTYVLGKFFTGISFVICTIVVFALIADIIALNIGNSYGYQTNFWDIWGNIFAFDLPGILLTGSIMLFISLLFKNIIPAVPAMLLYYMYANIGTISADEGYHYQVKPGAVFVRFPQMFTETEVPSGIIENQIFLLILAIILLVASIQIWERRRDA